MVKGKNNEFSVKSIMKTVSYGTGLVCKKVTGLNKKVTRTKAWKEMVAGTKEVCETVGEKVDVVLEKVVSSVEKSTQDIGASFQAGMESVTERGTKADDTDAPVAPKKRPAGKTGTAAKRRVKKVVTSEEVEKAAPANVDLEKEIEGVTQDVKEI